MQSTQAILLTKNNQIIQGQRFRSSLTLSNNAIACLFILFSFLLAFVLIIDNYLIMFYDFLFLDWARDIQFIIVAIRGMATCSANAI